MCRMMRGIVVAGGMALAVVVAPLLVSAAELPMNRTQAMERDLVLASTILDVQRTTPYRAFRVASHRPVRLARDVQVDQALMEELLPATGEELSMPMSGPQALALSLDPLLDTGAGLVGMAGNSPATNAVSVSNGPGAGVVGPPAVVTVIPTPITHGVDGGGGGGFTASTRLSH